MNICCKEKMFLLVTCLKSKRERRRKWKEKENATKAEERKKMENRKYKRNDVETWKTLW